MAIFDRITADPKTSIVAIVGALASILTIWGLDLSTDTQLTIVSVIIAILGFVSRDTAQLSPEREPTTDAISSRSVATPAAKQVIEAVAEEKAREVVEKLIDKVNLPFIPDKPKK